MNSDVISFYEVREDDVRGCSLGIAAAVDGDGVFVSARTGNTISNRRACTLRVDGRVSDVIPLDLR